MTTRARPDRFGWAMLAAVYLFWGSTFLSIRVMVQQADPLSTAGVRFALAGVLLLGGLAVVRGTSAIRCSAREVRILAGLGLLHFLIANGLVSIASQEVPSGLAAVLFATVPLFAAAMHLGTDPARAFVSGGVGLGGVMLAVGEPVSSWGRGEVLVVAAAAAWALAGILARRWVPAHVGAARSSGYQMCFGGLALLAVALLRGEDVASVVALDHAGVTALTHLILIGSIAGFVAYQWCLAHLPAALTTSHAYVNPIVAVSLGAVLLHEHVGPGMAAGALVVCLAVALSLTGPAPSAATRKPPNRPSIRSLTPVSAAPGGPTAKESLS